MIQALCHGAVVQLFAHAKVLQASWKFSHPVYMGFVDCFIHRTLLGGSMGNAVEIWAASAISHELSNSCISQSESLSVLFALSQVHSGIGLHQGYGLLPILLWTECLKAAKEWRELHKCISDPEYFGGIIYPTWSWKASVSPRKNWMRWLGRRTSGLPWLACCFYYLALAKRQKMDGIKCEGG